MSPTITIFVDGMPRLVQGDITLAAALSNAGIAAFRRDIAGLPRAPVCGMGTCHECRVTVNGVRNVRACLEPLQEGMSVETAT